MLIRFSISNKGGMEVFSYEPESRSQKILTNPQLVSGFLQALQSFSDLIGSQLKAIQFFNMSLYIKSYGEFSLRLFVSTTLDEDVLEHLLDELAKLTILKIDSFESGKVLNNKKFENEIKLILNQIEVESPIQIQMNKTGLKPYIKIIMAGLAKAGKTSIKKSFFERLSIQKMNDIGPTVGIERSDHFQEIINKSINIVDLGGQSAFISEHLLDSNIWNSITCVIFVIDLQNPSQFEKSFDYLNKIWEVSKRSDNPVNLAIFLHKYDTPLRGKLEKNLQNCLLIFKSFINIATFYLTTLYDESFDVAMMKTLYLSLPNIILKQQLEEYILDRLEQSGTFISLKNAKSDSLETSGYYFHQGYTQGFDFSIEFQELWLKVLSGNWKFKSKSVIDSKVQLRIAKSDYILKIKNWSEANIPTDITNIFITGFLKGLLSSFHLSKVEIIDKNENFTTWCIPFD